MSVGGTIGAGLDRNVTLRTGRAIWGTVAITGGFLLFIWDALGLDGWGVFFPAYNW